ncbi:MAG: imidazoleglycerol-phosphate dehydratase HisB [Calditrichaeota bacterium]|nr:MAG: imidazoleglycerol-phosphate dehydratase HisB [Calditrichota bacterium]
MKPRTAEVQRETRETRIRMKLNIDGSGRAAIASPIGFLTHMLETLTRHGIFDLEAHIEGDLQVDQHHTVEDTGIVLGEAFKQALGEKRGIRRAGFFIYPMDEALARVAVDLSGRPFLKYKVKLAHKTVGDLHTDLVEDFFLGFATALGANLHIKVHYGRSDHHKIEAVFKALGRALKEACQIEPRLQNQIPSTKGAL